MHLLYEIIQIYIIIVVVNALLSWFEPTGGEGFIHRIRSATNYLVEPLLRPIRRMIPGLRAGSYAIDVSPIILIVVLQIVALIIARYA